MKNPTMLLRTSYWLGAIVDGFMVVPMLSARVGGVLFGIDDFDPGDEYRYAMMIGASLMLGWTVLLLWAGRRPLERKGVLLITMFPVIVGLALAGVYAAKVGMIGVERMIPIWVLQAILIVLFSYSYRSATRAKDKSVERTGDRS